MADIDDQTQVQEDATQAEQAPVSDEQKAEVTEEVAEEPKESEAPVISNPSTSLRAGSSEKSQDLESTDSTSPAPLNDAEKTAEEEPAGRQPVIASTDDPNAKWYVIHTFAGHENKVLNTLKQRVEAEHLENKIFDILVPTQDKIEIRGGKKETVKEKIFPGYILVKMILDDNTWLTVRTTQGVTSFIGAGTKPIPISEAEVNSIVKFTTQGAAPTFKDVFLVDDTVKIVDGPFSDFIGKVESVDKEKGRVRVLVSIFGRETPVELDFLQIQKL